MKTIILAENPFEPSTWETCEVDNIADFMMTRFPTFPATARIYHRNVAESCDVTPADEHGVRRLLSLDGPFYVVVYPGEPTTIVIAIVAVMVAVAASTFLKPPPKQERKQNGSSNNSLSDRQNEARVNERIPDIFGTVRSVPDLLAYPYRVFKDNEEVEYAYMCIGRGDYAVSDIRDGATLVSDIVGTTVEVFGPNTSPNSGTPHTRVGPAITGPFLSARRFGVVNGQVLRPPNTGSLQSGEIYFESPNQIKIPTGHGDFTSNFTAGDVLVVSGSEYLAPATVNRNVKFKSDGTILFAAGEAVPPVVVGQSIAITGATYSVGVGDSIDLNGVYIVQAVTSTTIKVSLEYADANEMNEWWHEPGGTWSPYQVIGFTYGSGTPVFNLDGTYNVLTVTPDTITLSSPEAVNAAWTTYVASNSPTPQTNATLTADGPKWIGPFTVDAKTMTQVFANFVAPSGMYKDDGSNQYQTDVTIQMELTPVDAAGVATGPAQFFQATVTGSKEVRSQRAVTLMAQPAFTGLCRVRACRLTNKDTSFNGTVMDEVTWRDVYAMSAIAEPHFGDVTTVRSMTYANASSFAVKERKLNMLVTRKVPQRIGSTSTFTTEKYPTNRADDILCAICLDPFIGRRSITELDVANIYDTVAAVQAYFGTSKVTEFCATLDDGKMSFEETVVAVATVIFCVAYRRGNQIKLSLEKETQDSTLLFNHRNKLPGTESRTIRFGNFQDHDGVELEYVDPADDAIVTFHIPESMSALNPKKIELIGIRSRIQAYFHAWRAWNKIRYQAIETEFEATQEADLLVIQDRILVADNTRPETQDGEVVAQEGLMLQLSQPITFKDGVNYTIFLQLPDGTVQAIPVTKA